MPSIFAHNAASAHRATRRILSPSSDIAGRPLRLWWPSTGLSSRRQITESNSNVIPAFEGTRKREEVDVTGGLKTPTISHMFHAELKDFPTANPPRAGVCFNAGPTFAESVMYFVVRATTVAGIVEIEATDEP